MSYLIIIINSIIYFLISNIYIIYKMENFKIPIVIVIFLGIFVNIFPVLFAKKIFDNNLSRIRDGYSLLIIFLVNIFLSSILYLFCIIRGLDFKVLFKNLLILVPMLSIIFWNGIIRVYLFSKQLGIKYRYIGFVLGLIPIAHLIMLIKIIKVCIKEVKFENAKIKLDLDRKELQVCKTRYPLLLVHGIFFRDFEKLNYWGRIPNELIKNGATIYYGNHSSSLCVSDSALELANRIKEIVKETNCEKVNIIAHSKGGLDARYAISNLGMDKYVASLSMINTPNHGCVFADYLLEKTPQKFKNKLADSYNFALKKLGDINPDFIAGVTDLTSRRVEELNKKMKAKNNVYYRSYGSVLKKPASGRFPLNLTNKFVEYFDGKNDGLVGIKSFPMDKNFTLIETLYKRGISHGDVIDLNRENIDGYDVREFYVQLVKKLKEKGY